MVEWPWLPNWVTTFCLRASFLICLPLPLKSTRADVQIAGVIARRIVCRLKAGDVVHTGERFGMIKFGSRVDLTLPAETEIKVRVGDRVRGGQTIMGVMPDGE